MTDHHDTDPTEPSRIESLLARARLRPAAELAAERAARDTARRDAVRSAHAQVPVIPAPDFIKPGPGQPAAAVRFRCPHTGCAWHHDEDPDGHRADTLVLPPRPTAADVGDAFVERAKRRHLRVLAAFTAHYTAQHPPGAKPMRTLTADDLIAFHNSGADILALTPDGTLTSVQKTDLADTFKAETRDMVFHSGLTATLIVTRDMLITGDWSRDPIDDGKLIPAMAQAMADILNADIPGLAPEGAKTAGDRLRAQAAATIHYSDPRVRQLAETRWRMQTGCTHEQWLALGNHNDPLITEARDWLRAAAAIGLVPLAKVTGQSTKDEPFVLDHLPTDD